MVKDVANVKIAARVELNAVRLIHRRLRGRAAVARKSGLSRTGDGRNDSLLRVNAAHSVIEPFDEEHVAPFVEANFVRLIERGVERRSAIARIAFPARAGDSRDYAVPIDFTDDVIHRVADVKSAVGPSRDAEGIVELGFRGLGAVTRVTRLSGPGESFYLRLWR
jgi:hypothetical protein